MAVAARKTRPKPALEFVLHPERDPEYAHFENAAAHPFDARAAVLTRRNAWWLADAALLAYWGAGEAETRLRAAGLSSATITRVHGFDGYVAWNDTFVIVAMRGTQPDEPSDIVTDAKFELVPYRDGTRVHKGFLQSLDEVWSDIERRLQPLQSSRSVWFTGHSLGAALAVLAAYRYPHMCGVCTVGCPRVGDAAFASAFNGRLAKRSVRYACNEDIVTRVPPPLPGRYTHVSQLRHIRADGTIVETEPSLMQRATDAISSWGRAHDVADMLRGKRTPSNALLDHMPRAYAVDIWNDYAVNGN